ncbi:hypothetical protein FPQ10_09100 [Allobacillus sp. SKP2-8]|uniref:hypothetical protein n=1 Tax=unclassified Allobacillus TaxID=2628859 RepID=UPI0011844CB7|nr:hypothetical protein [Allobacillus sp. SKP2-8]TSJ65780.1 hypothetical protein FPQ10_09100 [Allobacillus sp. SKP2-8]
MVLTTKIYAIAMIVISMVVALAVYYLMTDLPKKEKKKQIDELTSQIVNFVIYIWIAKILLNLSLFITDPMAVLAYPSSAEAFYLAALFSVITLAIQSYRKKLQVIPLIMTFIPVFLISTFLFEFMQFTVMDESYAISQIVLSGLLLIVFYWIQGKVSIDLLILIMLVGWSAGMMGLTFMHPFVTVFDYLMKPWFIGTFFVGMFALILLHRRKRDN